MLLPTTLPTAMSRSPRRVAMSDVATSGIDVPAATMVRPTMKLADTEAVAIATAPSTSHDEPSTSNPRPARM